MTPISNRRGTHRLADGGAIDRSVDLHFHFDGKAYIGHPGDTLASALLANGVTLMARSFKLHRPRGVLSAGVEEPNALVQLRTGARTEPNTRATTVALHDGLEAFSQNRWPNLRFDLQALTGLIAPLIPAGFYYKTFKWPASAWHWYEKLIRNAAGMGHAPQESDPDVYAHRHVDCDLLVVGGGVAGISAAIEAARGGLEVILADEREALGGMVRWDGTQGEQWLRDATAHMQALPNLRVLKRSTVFGYYDHNQLGVLERIADHLPAAPALVAPRQRLWHIRAGKVVLATGAIERPMLFGNNDLPGIVLASAARAYVRQYAVRIGERAVVCGNCDDMVDAALALHERGIGVAAVIDARPAHSLANGVSIEQRLRALGISYLAQSLVVAAHGGLRVQSVSVRAADGSVSRIACDSVLMAGGWNPVVHLHSQSGGKLRHDEELSAFIPAAAKQPAVSAGAARGVFAFNAVLRDGQAAGRLAASGAPFATLASDTGNGAHAQPLRYADQFDGAPCFVDFQADVTLDDIDLAVRENYRSVEHLKRYTTLGMGTDQGKTSNVNGLALLAQARAQAIADVGTTTFRPPYTPVTLGALSGAAIGTRYKPTRRSPIHAWHAANGAIFAQAGAWVRAAAFPFDGETAEQASRREALNVRANGGLADVSSLGKISVQGPDAQLLLDRVCSNDIAALSIGRVRYALMLREDGIVLDDGTVARLDDAQFLLSATTAHAQKILSHLEFLLATVWPELRVAITDVTDQYAQFALAGPRGAALLNSLFPLAGIGTEKFPAGRVIVGQWQGVAVTLSGVSFSGEAACELAIAAEHGIALWQALLKAGADFGIAPYGADAVTILRIEAGHVAGTEINGNATPADLGLAKLAVKPRDFIGRHLLSRPGLQDAQRPTLVGLIARDDNSLLRAGAAIVATNHPGKSIGWISASTWSPHAQRWLALAFVENGAALHGTEALAMSPLHAESIAVRIIAPAFRQLFAAPTMMPLQHAWHDAQITRIAYRFASTRVTDDTPPHIARIKAYRHNDASAVADLLRAIFGIAHPLQANRSAKSGDLEVLAEGPGSWVVLSRADVLATLSASDSPLPALAALTGLSAGRHVRLLIDGPRARDLLADACAFDLSARNFQPGDVRHVSMQGVAVLLHCLTPPAGDGDAFHLLLPRSYAASLIDWLGASGVAPASGNS